MHSATEYESMAMTELQRTASSDADVLMFSARAQVLATLSLAGRIDEQTKILAKKK